MSDFCPRLSGKETPLFACDPKKAYLWQFLKLYQSYEKAQKLVVQYHEVKDLMLRTLSLPEAESDLLMRYQTTLEHRLSSAIGELLALQRSARP